MITVIIPTKNRHKDLLIAVSSIVTQSLLPTQLIIVDQSETPVSKSLIEDLIKQTCINLTYIYDKSITGLVQAKKIGVSFSSGNIVCFLEDDIELDNSYLQEMKLAFELNPTLLGCCGVVTNLGSIPKYYTSLFHLFHRGIFHDQRVGVHGFTEQLSSKLIPSRYLSGGTSAYRRNVFENIFYDLKNDFFMLEDIDFSSRAADYFGASHFFINPNAKLAHYMSPINRAVFEKKYTRKLREFIVFYKKNKHKPRAEFDLLLLLVGLLLEASLMSFKQGKTAPIVGYFKGLLIGFKWDVNKDYQCK